MRTVHGPDGRRWQIRRRPVRRGVASYVMPGAWQVDATSDDEHRRWLASGLLASSTLQDDVGLALRTGSEGPAGEVAVIDAPSTEDDGFS